MKWHNCFYSKCTFHSILYDTLTFLFLISNFIAKKSLQWLIHQWIDFWYQFAFIFHIIILFIIHYYFIIFWQHLFTLGSSNEYFLFNIGGGGGGRGQPSLSTNSDIYQTKDICQECQKNNVCLLGISCGCVFYRPEHHHTYLPQ